MKFCTVALCVALAFHSTEAFSIAPSSVVANRHVGSQLFSATLDSPPTDSDETYGTIVGDTKGAALRLNNVAISRGASPLLKDIDWSVQPNERWGIGTFQFFWVISSNLLTIPKKYMCSKSSQITISWNQWCRKVNIVRCYYWYCKNGSRTSLGAQ
jgi:hypothetical protein